MPECQHRPAEFENRPLGRPIYLNDTVCKRLGDRDIRLVFEESKDRDSARRAYVYVPIDDHWGEEFVAGSETVAAARGLFAVVKLMGKVRRVESIKHRWKTFLAL